MYMVQIVAVLPHDEAAHPLLEVTNILFSTCTNFHRNLLMCSSVKSLKLSQ